MYTLARNSFLEVDDFIASGKSEAFLYIDSLDSKKRLDIGRKPCIVRLVRDKNPEKDGTPRVLATNLMAEDDHQIHDI